MITTISKLLPIHSLILSHPMEINTPFNKGHDGFLAFDAKTALIKHYELSLGAIQFKGLRMIINSHAATKLIRLYFKN